jgi:hypothetical protein
MSITTTPYGFIPTQVAGLALWLDASDTTTITQSSGTITQWTDKSTSALTATAVNNPTLVAKIQNGLPGISLDGSTQYFNLGNNLNMGTNQIYIFVVSKFNSTADGAIIGKSLYGSAGARYSLLRSGALIPLIEASGGAVNNSGFNSDTSTSPRLLNMVWDRSTIYLYQNGSSVFSVGLSDSSNLTTGNSLLIGAYQNGSGGTPPAPGLYMNGYIHEILMYFTSTGSPLGNTSRQQIESYLAQKWGLTLGAGHPGLTSTVFRSTYLKNSAVKRNIATMTPFFTGFTPRQIGGLGLWLDSTDSSTISFSSGSNISQWRDKSGSSNHFSLTSGTTTTILDNRKTVVNFPSGAIMSSANQITFTTSSAFYIVSRLTTTNLIAMLLGFTNIANGSSSGDFSIRFVSSSLHGTIAQGNTQDFANRTYYVNGTFDPSFGSNVYFNVYSIIGTVAPLLGGTSFLTLSSSFLSRFFIGYIAEFLYYPAGVNSTQRQQIESYLAQKWDLTSSLAADHSHLTQPAGARTALSLVNSKMTLTNSAIVATGGTITTVGSFKFHTFTYPGGTFTVTANPKTVQVLVVGGGGGGGGYYNGGGGGAGGAIYNSAFSVSITSYTVTVGNGGAGASGGNNPGINGTSGGATTFSTLTGNGGGGGGADNNVNGLTGGCGGGMGPLGATAPGSGNQGFAGGFGTNGPNMGTLGGAYGTGYGGGGGGGMGSVGSNALTSAGPGWGGTGFTYVVGGQNYLVAGGGGGGTADTNNTNFGLGGSSIGGVGGLNTARVAGNGTANTGSGGGGYGRVGTGSAGGTGGTGIVVIAYRI